jgi:hypothetical protein
MRVVIRLVVLLVSLGVIAGTQVVRMIRAHGHPSAPAHDERTENVTETLGLYAQAVTRCEEQAVPLEETAFEVLGAGDVERIAWMNVPWVRECPDVAPVIADTAMWPGMGAALTRYLTARRALATAEETVVRNARARDPDAVNASLVALEAALHAEWLTGEEVRDLGAKCIADVDERIEALIAPDAGREGDVRALRVMSASQGITIALRHVQSLDRDTMRAQLGPAIDRYVAAVAILPTTPRTAYFRSQALAWQSTLLAVRSAPDDQLEEVAHEAFDAHRPLLAAFNHVGVYY